MFALGLVFIKFIVPVVEKLEAVSILDCLKVISIIFPWLKSVVFREN